MDSKSNGPRPEVKKSDSLLLWKIRSLQPAPNVKPERKANTARF